MNYLCLSSCLAVLTAGGLGLSACSTPGGDTSPGLAAPSAPTEFPARYAAAELVGRWGVASYHRDADRARMEVAARGQCGKAYVISKGPTGGVMMHLPDQRTAQELRLKGAADSKTYIGPAGEAGGEQDREILSFDGRVLVVRYIDPEVAGRFGTMVYVRCAPRA
jgi:hypothetical protein